MRHRPRREVTTQARMTAAERREQLLDVTKALAVERGFHEVSIEAVAREAGITRPIVYGHFRDLRGLLEALVDREGARALAQLAAVVPREIGEPRDSLLGALRGYLEAVESDPATWRLVLMPPEGAPPLLREQIALGREATIAQLAAAVGPGMLDSPDAELTARTLSALADESARLLLLDPDRYPAQRILDHAGWLLDTLRL